MNLFSFLNRGACAAGILLALGSYHAALAAELSVGDMTCVEADACSILIDGTGYIVKKHFDQNYAGIVTQFNKSAADNKLDLQVTGCSTILDIIAGSKEGDVSHGGVCYLAGQSRELVEICNDDVFGHFNYEPVMGIAPTFEQLGQFTAKNCFGGSSQR